MLPDKQRHLITAALSAAGRHGFALGGSSALAAHGLPGFTAKKIDLVTSRDAVRDTAKEVEKALRRAGYQPERLDTTPELRHILPQTGGTLAQWRVPTAGRHAHPPRGGIKDYTCGKCHQRSYLEMARAPRGRDPVATSLGPVLHAEDAAGAKMRDLARRGRASDYADAARLLEHWSPRQLTGFARRLDPKLGRRDFDRAADRLGSLPDVALTALGAIRPQEVSQLRERFANWQRDTRDTHRESARQHERPAHGREPREKHDSPREHRQQQPVPASRPRGAPQRAEPARPQPGSGTTARARTAAVTVPVRQPPVSAGRALPRPARQREAAARSEPETGR